jgi:hypothetical protein
MDFVSEHPSTSQRDSHVVGSPRQTPWTPQGPGRWFLLGWLGVFVGLPVSCVALTLARPSDVGAGFAWILHVVQDVDDVQVVPVMQVVRVQGRLLDTAGKPVAGVRVQFVPYASWLADLDRLAAQRSREASLRAQAGVHPARPAEWTDALRCPSIRTNPDGSFVVFVFGDPSRPRSGRVHLQIALREETTFNLPAPPGDWNPAPPSDDPYVPYATWDLGDLRLP